MKLLRLTINEEFRSLHKGFTINFHQMTKKGMSLMEEFQPFCFAGLNGSGKSNVLEALASIFYHLEFCVAKYHPDNFNFRREVSKPDAFELEYLIGEKEHTEYKISNLNKVLITKEIGGIPQMTVEKVNSEDKGTTFPLNPAETDNQIVGQSYLPDIVIGYSSGENEILSLPFLKSRLVNFDEYVETFYSKAVFNEPQSSLIYVDEEMSQAVLLAALIFEDDDTLEPLRDELGIIGLRSFRIHLNNHGLTFPKDGNTGDYRIPILGHIDDEIKKLKQCSTSWFEFKDENVSDFYDFKTIIIDFFIDEEGNTQKIFKEYFKSSFELFRFFQTLYELNFNVVNEGIKKDVYQSTGVYTKNKISIPAPNDQVFRFQNLKNRRRTTSKRIAIA
ncbi:MAG: restriction system-associated AAA family ATPase [Chitinophagales bacterium]